MNEPYGGKAKNARERERGTSLTRSRHKACSCFLPNRIGQRISIRFSYSILLVDREFFRHLRLVIVTMRLVAVRGKRRFRGVIGTE